MASWYEEAQERDELAQMREYGYDRDEDPIEEEDEDGQ